MYKLTYKFIGLAEQTFEVAGYTPFQLLGTLAFRFGEPPYVGQWLNTNMLEYMRLETIPEIHPGVRRAAN